MSLRQKEFVEFGPFSFDVSEQVLRRDGETVKLSPRAAGILKCLIVNRERFLSREELKQQIWPNLFIDDNNVDQRIGEMRRALGTRPDGSLYIEAKYKHGWRFAADVSRRTEAYGDPLVSSEPAISDPAIETPRARSRSVPGSWFLRIGVLLAALVAAPVTIFLFRNPEPRVLKYTQLTNDGRPKQGPLVTNGRDLFFMEEIKGTNRIVSIPVSGGEPVPLPIDIPNPWLLDVSQDGSLLLVRSYDRGQLGIWAYPLKGGVPRLLSKGMEYGGWSPDTQSIAVADAGVLAITDVRSPGALRVANLPGLIGELRWSPDGRRIRFSYLDRLLENRSVWEFDRRTKRLGRVSAISNGSEMTADGVWTADGRYYVYEAGTETRRQLRAMRESGWHQGMHTQLTDGHGSWIWPAVSPAGSTVFALSAFLRPELVRWDANSQSWKAEWQGAPVYEVDFSRDGKWAAYAQYPDHTIWKARADGTGRTRLTDQSLEAHQPRWFPDGSKIGFMAKKKTGEWRIFTVPPSGGKLEELLPAHEDQGVPTWSPDGRFVVFGDLQLRKPRSKMSIHLFDIETRQLSEVRGSEGLWTARWSPNGQYLAALTSDSKKLVVARWTDLRWKELSEAHLIDDVAWSPDSRHIYFDSETESGHRELHRVSIPERKVGLVADLTEFTLPEDPWFGVAADGTPLGFRATSAQEIWALQCDLP